MIRLKICGITRLEDALLISARGAYALGFIFFRGSSRYIEKEKAKEIADQLPPYLCKIGVFVNESSETIVEHIHFVGLSAVQLSGQESVDYCQDLKDICNIPIIKVLHVNDSIDLDIIRPYISSCSAIHLDTYNRSEYGGTGKTFQWSLAVPLKQLNVPIIISGGINAQNIRDAYDIIEPYAIDISSSIESAPGIKDHSKIHELFDVVSI